jgi:hypothetical protein
MKSLFLFYCHSNQNMWNSDKFIKPIVEEKDLNCLKADDPTTNNAIIKDIVEHIYKSRFVIADITERNSNVLYEIGVADPIFREVIMINDRLEKINDSLEKKKQDYPFDINYRRIVNYDNTIAGGQDFRKVLGKTIDFVLVKTAESNKEPETQSIETDKLNQLVWQSNLQYRLRARRIEWFTYHPIHFLSRFAKFHTDILKELEQLHTQFSSEKFEIIKRRCGGYIPNPEYIKSFIMTELNDTKDFISNAWIVNKFPDELNTFGLGGTLTQLSTLSEVEFEFKFKDIIEGINFNLERLNFYISAMQDERTEVGLPLIDLNKK